ncbi:MAG TPA: AAA family ATPase [Thermoguttaceae bacterium]|nr:AAA family ATPase [Thermoguttaceae bacterium]
MLSSFAIRNFRCFRDLAVDNLGRVNLIGGRNNAGKTALLEAVYLHCVPDKPQQWVDIHGLRGIEHPVLAMEALARWLFLRGHSDSPIEARSRDVEGVERSTEFHLVDPATSRDKFPNIEESIAKRLGAEVAGSEVSRLILRFRTGGKQWDSVTLCHEFASASLNAPVPAKISTVFLGSQTSDRKRDVAHFGELESSKRLDEVISSLQIIEPRLRRLSLVPFPKWTEIHGDVEGMSRLVPVPLIGEGMRRLLSMVLAIANVPGGIVLIDEIENGLHYSVLPNVWKALADAARRNDVQVFAATHSWECLRAAHEAFCQEEPYDFRYYRLDREDGEATCVAYDREMIETSLTMGMEAR